MPKREPLPPGRVDMTRLAEHGRDWSTLIAHYPHGYVETCIPNYGEQELVGVFARAILEQTR